MLNNLKNGYLKRDAPIVFLIFALFFGAILIILTPPFQAPDEVAHFCRSYQISEGNFIAVKDSNRLGGYIPKSIVDVTEIFYPMTFDHSEKITTERIISSLKIPLVQKKKVFKDFSNTGLYSPVSYIPESVCILVLRILNTPPLLMMYITKLFTLIFWAIGIYFVLKIIPVYKWLFALLALFPMSLFISSSISADVMTNLLSFLIIAYTLRCAFTSSHFTIKNFIVLLILVILLTYAKVVYSALIFLFLLIPSSKFSSKKAYYLQFLLLLLAVAINMTIWTGIINKLYVPIRAGTDMIAQKHFVLHHPFFFVKVFLQTLSTYFKYYKDTYIGNLGSLAVALSPAFIKAAYTVLFALVLIDNDKIFAFRKTDRIILLISFIALIFLLILSQYLTWESPGAPVMQSIQGRYFIPIFPLLFIIPYGINIGKQEWAKLIFIVFTCYSLSYASYALYNHYFDIPPIPAKITCNAEAIIPQQLEIYGTDIDGRLTKNGLTISKEQAHSGTYSYKADTIHRIGFLYRFSAIHRGDSIAIAIWRNGKGGQVFLEQFTGSTIPFTFTNVIPGKNGWEELQGYFKAGKEFPNNELLICIYNPSNACIYFDDLVMQYFNAPYQK